MTNRHVIIIGGGMAGLSAGCYALRNGFSTTIVEHNLALGGVCTAWSRGAYTVDGCIHWLMGGPFERFYRELEVVPGVALRPLDTWFTYRDVRRGTEVAFTRDLDALFRQLSQLSRQDAPELMKLRQSISELTLMQPPLDAPEVMSFGQTLRSLWAMREGLGTLVHYRQPLGAWLNAHLVSPELRRIFTTLLPESVPALVMLMVLGYLEQGYLSRPVGGTTAFRDALADSYRRLGGEVLLHSTVDEVLVQDQRATGVRLADGTQLAADLVVSTSSAPETVLRLLAGSYDAESTRQRLTEWQLLDAVVLASFGVAEPYADSPSLLMLDGIEPLHAGGRTCDHLYLRVCNDDPSFAPAGHTVVQAVVPTDYQWWATRGSHYQAEKDALAQALLGRLDVQFKGLRSALRMTDLATPLTYWNMARSWRGAYEGWIPAAGSSFVHLKKKLSGLSSFYMAGQWVEPGGGVPLAIMSGRQVVQLMCLDADRPFVAA